MWRVLGLLVLLVASPATAQTSVATAGSTNPGVAVPSCISANASGASLSCAGKNLYGFYCGSISGGAAGYCVAIAGTTVPSNGASITPLDFCYFDTTPRGCSLAREPGPPRNYSGGVIILITSASSPFTYTTGTDTGAMSADAQ